MSPKKIKVIDWVLNLFFVEKSIVRSTRTQGREVLVSIVENR